MRNRPIYDVVALIARCGVGTVFIAHGWQKIQVGVTATARNLDAMGAPFPTAAAVYSTFVELLGGAALILGLALPVAGALLFVDMTGALIFVHAKHGIFLVDNGRVQNGFELALVLGLAALVFTVGGGGRLTLDHRIFGRTRPSEPERTEPEPGELVPPTPPAESIRTEPVDAPRRRPRLGSSRKRATSSKAGSSSEDAVQGGQTSSREPAVSGGTNVPGEPTVPLPPAERTAERPIPPAGNFPVPPDADETSSGRPRLAAEMITDTSRDVIVAGDKKPAPSPDDTTPARTRKKPPKPSDA